MGLSSNYKSEMEGKEDDFQIRMIYFQKQYIENQKLMIFIKNNAKKCLQVNRMHVHLRSRKQQVS